MHRSHVSQIKETLRQAIRNAPFRGQAEIIATDEETLNAFEGVTNHSDIKQMLQQKGVIVNFVLSKS